MEIIEKGWKNQSRWRRCKRFFVVIVANKQKSDLHNRICHEIFEVEKSCLKKHDLCIHLHEHGFKPSNNFCRSLSE